MKLQTIRAAVVGVVAAALTLVVFAPVAAAHDPIFLADDQTTPDTGPYMPDGSISWALYGTVLADGDTRGFEFDLRDGDDLYISLLIPNLSPETELVVDDLPTLELEAPDGSITTIAPTMREVFDEPFSNTSYVTLAEHREPAQAGRYRGVVVGTAPSRFSVAIGETEIFFTETERSGDRVTNFAEISAPLTAWYTTAPGEEPAVDAATDGEGAVQMDLIEEAMESGVAQVPDEEAVAAGEPEVGEPAAATAARAPEADVEEVAAAATQPTPRDDADGGSGMTWIAPAAIGLIALAGAGTYMARSRRGPDTV